MADFGEWRNEPAWRADGKELFYLAPDRYLMAVPIKWARRCGPAPRNGSSSGRIIDCRFALYSKPICRHRRRSAVSHQSAGGKSVPGHHHGRCRLDRSVEKSFWLLTSRPAVQDGPRSAWHDQGSATRPPPSADGARICPCANAHRNHCRCRHGCDAVRRSPGRASTSSTVPRD